MDDKKISKNRQVKIEMVGQFEEKVKRAKAMVFADFRGLTHQQLEQFKKSIRKLEAEFVVTKNTLLKKALSTQDIHTDDFVGPTGTLFIYSDIVSPLKELAKMIKTLKLPLIKLGILDGKNITSDDVIKLANLPSREVLIAQVVGGMKSPIYGLHRALTWNLQKLVLTLKAIETKKQT